MTTDGIPRDAWELPLPSRSGRARRPRKAVLSAMCLLRESNPNTAAFRTLVADMRKAADREVPESLVLRGLLRYAIAHREQVLEAFREQRFVSEAAVIEGEITEALERAASEIARASGEVKP